MGSGVFGGITVGGSVGSTAMSVSMGSRTRWAAILSGVWMLLVLVALAGLAERAAMPALAAILVVAAAQSINRERIERVWRAGAASRVAWIITFLGSLTLPVAAAVGIGVALSIILYVGQQVDDVEVVELYEDDTGALSERPVPAWSEPSRRHALVILADYADDLAARGGHLTLSGVEPALIDQLRASHRIDAADPIHIVRATDRLGESTRAAIAGDEHLWVDVTTPDPGADRFAWPWFDRRAR